jgi:hypothetical protein
MSIVTAKLNLLSRSTLVLAGLIVGFLAAPGLASETHHNRHVVQAVDRAESAAVEAGRNEDAREQQREKNRMIVHILNEDPVGFQEPYVFAEPKAAVEVEPESKSHALVWIGATGAALVAGAAAWFIFSQDEPSESSHTIVAY